MGPRLVPATMVAAALALAVAAGTAGAAAYRPAWWPAAVALAILGGVTPMIYAVNIRVVPVFSRRAWPSAGLLRAQVALAVAGAWAVFGGRLAGQTAAEVLGQALALAGAILFAANIARLFRRPPTAPAPPLPFPAQVEVDRLATRFTRLAGVYLLVGLAIGLGTSLGPPAGGRSDLVWAHALLVGFVLSMAAGVSYHVLSRWTGRPWPSAAPIRWHLLVAVAGLPPMLLALATGQRALFAVAGPLQAVGVALFLATVAPMLPALPGPTRPALTGATACLLIGIGFGAAFAVEPALGARLRLVHAQLNLFGWAGLLISGVGYYLVPRFAGRPLRWPRLATVQLAALAGGVLLVVLVRAWSAVDAGAAPGGALAIAAGHALVALGFLLLGTLFAGTFAARPGVGRAATVATLTLAPRSRPVPAGGATGGRVARAAERPAGHRPRPVALDDRRSRLGGTVG